MYLQNLPDNCNYVEIALVSQKSESRLVFDQPYDDYLAYLMKIKSIKYFEKEFKCYQFNNMFYENHFHKENKIYTKNFKHVDQTSDHALAICYCEKEKHPFHAFPSTKSISNTCYVKRLTFRIHNRLYLNFETQFYPKNNSYVRKIYLNYNHEHLVDKTLIEENIKRIISTLKS